MPYAIFVCPAGGTAVAKSGEVGILVSAAVARDAEGRFLMSVAVAQGGIYSY